MSFEAVHAGYGRVLVNGTLSVKASFAGQLFRLHRQSAGVLRLFVPGRLARRPLRGLGHAGPLEQRAPGPESKYAAASAITAASAPVGSAGSGRKLSRRPCRISDDRASVPRLRPPPGGARSRALSRPRCVSLQGIGKRVLLERVRSRVAGDPAGLRPGSEVGPLDPDHGSDKNWPVMDIVPPPSEDQVPQLQAFRAEHPGYRDRQPRRLAHGHVVGLPGRHDPGGQIRPVPAARPP